MRAFLIFAALFAVGMVGGHALYPKLALTELLTGAACLAGFSMIGVLMRR